MKPDPARAFYVIPNGAWPGPAVAAVKALGRGEARADQQIAALNFIIEELCRCYDLSFRPDDVGGSRETDFSEGKRFVALQIRRALTASFEDLTGRKTSGEHGE